MKLYRGMGLTIGTAFKDGISGTLEEKRHTGKVLGKYLAGFKMKSGLRRGSTGEIVEVSNA